MPFPIALPCEVCAGSGVEPLVIVVEAADELREEELAAVVDAAGHASRPAILRVMRDG